LREITTRTGNIAIGSQTGINYTGAESYNILINSSGTLGDSYITQMKRWSRKIICALNTSHHSCLVWFRCVRNFMIYNKGCY
jgi:hypothetical protein